MKVVVCGAGQVGTTIARHLASEGFDVTVVDIDRRQVDRIDQSYDVRGVTGHASYPETLRKAAAHQADILIAVTRSDEVNMVACQMAYSLFGVKRRIARIRHAGYLAQNSAGLYATEHLPIDVIISPEIEIAERIAWRLSTPGAFDMVPMAGGLIEMLGIHVDESRCPLVGERLSDIAAGGRQDDMTVIAISRKGRSFVPGDGDRVELGDDVYVLARTDRVKEVVSAFGHRERAAKRLVIIGAGNVGLHLVQRVRRSGSSVDIKIIEHDAERARFVSSELSGSAIVLHGDALEQTMLEEAQADLAEMVVAVTNDDETNIFASVMAKRMGCKRAITLVNKRNYEALTPTLGIDSVVSPSAVTISTVLRHVRSGTISSLHTLREGFGEVVEAKLPSHSRLLRRPLCQLGLPVGMRIGAIIRDDQVIMARPDLQLQVDDHVVALVTYSYLKLAEALFGAAREPSS